MLSVNSHTMPLANQTISYAQFDAQYVKGRKENGTSFEDAMKDVVALFGSNRTGEENDRLVLTGRKYGGLNR